jgi:hypothetical protein
MEGPSASVHLHVPSADCICLVVHRPILIPGLIMTPMKCRGRFAGPQSDKDAADSGLGVGNHEATGGNLVKA